MQQQWPLPQPDMVIAHAGELGHPTQPSQSSAEVVLYAVRCALPLLLLSSLLVDLLFIIIGKIGDHMAGWGTIEDDMDDILLAAVKAKKARRRRRQDKEQKPKTRPRKMLLLFSNIALLLLTLVDGFAYALSRSIAARSVGWTPDLLELAPVIGAGIAYAWYSVKIQRLSPDAVATSILLKVTSAISLACNLSVFACLLAVAVLLDRPKPFLYLVIATAAFKAVASIIQASAYYTKLQEATEKDTKACQPEVTVESGANAGPEQAGTKAGDNETVENEEDDDDDEEPEKKRTVLDWPSTFKRFKRLLPFMLPGKSRLSYALIVVCIILALLVNVAVIFQPQQFGYIVNDLVAGRSPWHNFLVWAAFRAALNGGTVAVLRRALWNPVRSKISRNMDNMTFLHVLELGMLYHHNKRSGEVLSVLGRGGNSLANCLEYLLFQLCPLFINMAGSAAILASHFGPSVIAIIGTTAVAYLATLQVSMGRHAALRAEYVDRTDNTSAIKNESINNVELLKYFGMEPYEVNRYSKALLHTQKADWDLDIYAYTVQLIQDNVQVIGTVAGATLIARSVYNGELEVGVFVMYLTYVGSILNNLESLRWMSQWVNQMVTNTDKLMDILDEKNEIVDAEDAVELYVCKGQVSFENVTLCYPEKGKKPLKKPARKALDNVSFSVLPGQHIALVGETGAGKSTVFKLLYRFFEPQEGCIKVEGRDIRQYTQRSLRQALGVVQQEGMVFNDSIFSNIKYGDITAPDEKVMEAAKMAQIHDRIMEWPKGYQTVVGERGVKLSGGEKQRVNIARTILKNPKILLLDEATSALDSNTEKAIQGQLRRLTRGKTTIAIAHRLSTIAHADKIIVLDKGKIVETGTHDELLMVEGGFYKKLWETQTSTGKAEIDEEPSLESLSEASSSQAMA